MHSKLAYINIFIQPQGNDIKEEHLSYQTPSLKTNYP